jgi:hypothetical protein
VGATFPSSCATGVPSPTATATGAPAITAIAPATVANDQPAILTLTGAHFVAGMTATVGEQSLGDVRVPSATTLTGTLPTGLCPGTYAATVSDAQGTQVSGGALVVTGIRKATIGTPVPGPALKITGREQAMAVPLAALQLTDTTCGGNMSLAFSATASVAGAQGRQPLAVRSVHFDLPGMPLPASTAQSPGGDGAAGTLRIPRTGAPGMTTLIPTVMLVIPAKVITGQYAITLDVTLAP